MKQWKKHVVVLAGAALFGLAASANADEAPATGGSSGRGMGPGMMGGHGPETMGRGMMGGHGPETMGRGMMGGHGPETMGRGMMGGNGPETMGRGMMGGRGPATMGRGMRGGHGGAAPGARGMGLGTMLEGLDLTDEQRAALQPLDDELFRKQWEITGKTIEAQRTLRRQSSMQQRDDNAIAEAHKILQELRGQRLLAESQTREKLESLLTQEQRERLRSRGHECISGQA